MKCERCNEVKMVIYQDMPAAREANGSKFLIKGVPVKKCGCESHISLRVGLEIDYYAAKDTSSVPEVEYAVIAEATESLSNMDMIVQKAK